jgi:hypothetical protein
MPKLASNRAAKLASNCTGSLAPAIGFELYERLYPLLSASIPAKIGFELQRQELGS